MHVAWMPTRRHGRTYDYWFVRQSYREGGKVKHRTLANLSHLPRPVIDTIAGLLAGRRYVEVDTEGLTEGLVVERSLPHGHVAAVLGMVQKLGIDSLLSGEGCRKRDLAVALVVSRVVDPCSKLATSQRLGDTTLGEGLGIADASEDELYEAMDWLLDRQPRVEEGLARRHLSAGSVVLYDVTSTYVTGRRCELAEHGYSRDHRGDLEQVVFGLLLDGEGRPLGVEAFAGNTADPATVERQVEKLQGRYGLDEVTLVGDRGMLTQARIARLKERGGIGWISCLRAPAIRSLLEQGAIQLSLFDENNLVEIIDPSYPGERLVVCRNPLLGEERSRKREELMGQTEAALVKVQDRVRAGRLQGSDRIGVAVGKVVNRWKVGKHFRIDITDERFEFARDEEKIREESALDGLYVVRTSLPAERLDGPGVVETYKSLSRAERAFRTFKTMDLQVRPIFHYRERRVRAHLFLCLLAAYVQWHMEKALAPLLFREEEVLSREGPVAPPVRSALAHARERRKRTAEEPSLPVRSFRSLLRHLAMTVKNRIVLRPVGGNGHRAEAFAFDRISLPTPLQARAFELLGVKPGSL